MEIPILQNFLPSLAQLAGILAVLLASFLMILLGGLVGGSHRLREMDLISGWAIAGTALVLVGVVSSLPLTMVLYGLCVVALLSGLWLYRREGRLADIAILRVAVVGLPMILLVGAMLPSQWDEFSQWLPNARYLVELDMFPGTGRPDPVSAAPGYPPALSLVILIASRITGFMVENGAALFNVLLLLAFALLLARMIREALATPDQDRKVRFGLWAPITDSPGWATIALGALAATALNPTFVPKVAFTAYADIGTSVTFGAAAVLCWMMLTALAQDETQKARALAWQIGALLTAMLLLKQGNVALLGILGIAVAVVALRDRSVRLGAALKLLPAILVLPIVAYLAWRVYIDTQLGGAPFTMRPIGEWYFHLAGDVAGRMALIASKKGGYFGLMLIATIAAAVALFRMRTPFDRLALITGMAFVGYTVFLFCGYLSLFGEYDAKRAASYWRYNMHLGGLAMAFASYGAALLWRRYLTPRIRRSYGWIFIVLVIAGPIALSDKLRFDRVPPNKFVREIGEEIAGFVPPESRILVVDPLGNGHYHMVMYYSVFRAATVVGAVTGYYRPPVDEMKKFFDQTKATHLWVHETADDVNTAVGAPLPKKAAHLLSRSDEGWALIRSWDYPGYDSPGPWRK